jgi:hypothetical protein
MLEAPAPWIGLLDQAGSAIGLNRKPLLIGVDGRDGAGKSSVASWLAWQLGMPVIHLDLFLMLGADPLAWRTDDLNRAIGSRLDHPTRPRPVIVEGVLLLDALSGIERNVNLLAWITGDDDLASCRLSRPIVDYTERHDLPRRADVKVDWSVQAFQLRPDQARQPKRARRRSQGMRAT